VEDNVAREISAYQDARERWFSSGQASDPVAFVNSDPRSISWTTSLISRLKRNQQITYNAELIGDAIYRPFTRERVYFDGNLIHRLGKMARVFPSQRLANLGFYITAPGAGHPFSALAVDSVPDIALWGSGSGQFFPRYTYEPRGNQPSLFDDAEPYARIDNVTDEILAEYHGLYGSDVTKDDIFYFVYGLLHSPDYRQTYAADLKKMLPHIPKLASPADFVAFAAAGKKLAELHLGYESAEPYPLRTVIAPSAADGPDYRVTKMRFGGKAGAWDKSTIRYNDDITLSGIPKEAHEYLLGSRSAIEWILERYQVKVDKASGIRNDPNDWATEHDDPAYIFNLLKRIVTVSVETVQIVESLPALAIV
jgi:predicted helicase